MPLVRATGNLLNFTFVVAEALAGRSLAVSALRLYCTECYARVASIPSVVRSANVMRIVASGYCMRRIAFPHAPMSSRFAMLSEAVPWMRTHIDVRAVPCPAEPRLVVIIGNHGHRRHTTSAVWGTSRLSCSTAQTT